MDSEMKSEGTQVSPNFLSYINKALSRIIHLLPKTSEMVQTKICKSLKFIISRIEINHNALLPFFSYFHLNSNSPILTLTAIKTVEIFKNSLNKNFILKLVLKLCLLINDVRINNALRILSIRWILNLRFSNYNFNFKEHMGIFSYYLCPFPFDCVSLCLEKLKTLFLFYDNFDENDSDFIICSISIMDNYKYYPIFSNYIKSLFKTYFLIILRFPYKKFISNLCEILKSNLKEVPRILPNMINLLRKIKLLKESDLLLYDIHCIASDDLNEKMTFQQIHKYLLVEFSNFLAKFNSPVKLNKYFEMFLEISKEKSIEPENLIIGLSNLYNSIKDMRVWKIEKNILEVCKFLLNYHEIDVMKKYKIHDLLNDIYTQSFDYGIRDKAKLYYNLVINVEKPILNTFLDTKHNEFDFLNFKYEFIELEIKSFLNLEQSFSERKVEKINDGGSAIFDKYFNQNILLLSDSFENPLVYKRQIEEKNKPENLVNSRESKKQVESPYIITHNDILRLYIKDEMMDDTDDSQVDPKLIFQFEKEPQFSECENRNEEIHNFIEFMNSNNENSFTLENKNKLFSENFIKDYFVMIDTNKFHIKIPLNFYMKQFSNNSNKNTSENSILNIKKNLFGKFMLRENITFGY